MDLAAGSTSGVQMRPKTKERPSPAMCSWQYSVSSCSSLLAGSTMHGAMAHLGEDLEAEDLGGSVVTEMATILLLRMTHDHLHGPRKQRGHQARVPEVEHQK